MSDGTRVRAKMPVSQRAKQFMPFAAVTGLDEALLAKERELGLTDRRELPEEERRKILKEKEEREKKAGEKHENP